MTKLRIAHLPTRRRKSKVIGNCKACGKTVHEGDGSILNGIVICWQCDTGLDGTEPIIARASKGEIIPGRKLA